MADEGEAGHEPLFRANKRRKVVRKRADSEDILTTVPFDPDVATHDDEGQSLLSAPIRPQKALHQRKHGIGFTTAGKGGPQGEGRNEEMALVQMHPSREQHVAQSDRFTKPTGKVAVADDKHMYDLSVRHLDPRDDTDNVGWHS